MADPTPKLTVEQPDHDLKRHDAEIRRQAFEEAAERYKPLIHAAELIVKESRIRLSGEIVCPSLHALSKTSKAIRALAKEKQ